MKTTTKRASRTNGRETGFCSRSDGGRFVEREGLGRHKLGTRLV